MESDSPAHQTEQYQALLEVSKVIGVNRDLNILFRELAALLHRVVAFDYMNLILYNPTRNTMRLHILETRIATDFKPGLELPIKDSPGGWVWETQQPLIVQNVEEEKSFPSVMGMIREQGITSLCLLPLTTAHRRVGALGFGCTSGCGYSTADVEFMQQVASQVAVAVDNALNYEKAAIYQQQLAAERDRLRLLLEVNNAVVSNLEFRELFSAIAASLRRVMPCDYVSVSLLDTDKKMLRLHALDFPAGKGFVQEEMVAPVEDSIGGEVIKTRKGVLLDSRNKSHEGSSIAQRHFAEGLRSGCIAPLISRNRPLGTINVGSFGETSFDQEDLDLLTQVGNQVAIAIENALAFAQIAELKDKLAEEKMYLEDEIRSEHNFREIIGESPALLNVLNQVETVAPTDSTVLILGETGTGKEVIARAIHNHSIRRDRTFVKVNCAAIPTGLLESELFGHEKGAFTGAIAQKVGRFELANGGTIFLDEVGDIPLELQPKLLRVLQEQEFERLGANRTIRVNIRLIAATNRDLEAMVATHEFRSDLYYRLNVFPLRVPPLRERPEDVPLLVRYFAQKYARQMNKQIESVSTQDLEALSTYFWPGNVRELENLVERAVILTRGPVLSLPLSELRVTPNLAPSKISTLEDAERDHLLRALQESHWVIGGPEGAAAKLGLKRTTLHYKMQRLGIVRPAM
jgi:formate hydrogenlyase transcriptional activator